MFTREELLRSVWGFQTFGRTRTLDSHAFRLRRKLCEGSDDKLVVDVCGVGSGPLAPVKAAAVAGGLGALAGGLAFGPTRKLLDRLLPSPGEGPREETRRRGYFRIEIHARTSSGARHLARVAANGDPGYAATGRMMGEAAFSLALDGDRLPQRAGILTPAAALNGALAERLRAAGMTLDVERA